MFGVFYQQSEYSLLNNLIPVQQLVSLAKEFNYDFVTLADNNNLYGMYEFFKEAKKNEIKPIIGLKINVNFEIYKTGFLVYVKDDLGYANLLKISEIINLENRDLDYDELVKYQEGLIIITSGLDSIIDIKISNQNLDDAYRILKRFKKDLKTINVGLLLSNFNHEIMVAPTLVKMALESEVTLLPIQKTSYVNAHDKVHYETLKKVSGNTDDFDEGDLSFLTKEELEYRFSDYPFIFKNASLIAESVTFEFKLPKLKLPKIDTKGLSSDQYLEKLALEGLNKRLLKGHAKPREVYDKRLKYELEVINKLNYPDYFLIIQDFVKYAKNQGILVGPGRGSGASSLVAYSLNITEIDPIKYDLLFERFLNPARLSMPDIDLDFPDDRRDEVIEYVANKYGKNHIASIVTFDTFQFNSSIRDIARVKNLNVTQTNQLLESYRRGTLDLDDPEIKEIIDTSNMIINLPRHTGTHPAGIILSSEDLSKIIPLQNGPQSFPQTQWNMNDLEELGFLKIDFLGIKNLTIIDETVKLIQERNPSFRLEEISFDCPKTYELLQKGDTNGIFQLEQPGMQATLRKIAPTKFEDIVATLALYRPGPMANIDVYARRLKGEKYDKVNPILDEILAPTYGVIVYQEQIMQIANRFAGYSYAEADLLRRSISKKDFQTLKEDEAHFISSAQKLGHTKKLSQEIYDYIVKFADYGFNRAHSVSYATITYQMAYLKANYFGEFATTLLSNNVGNESLTKKYLQELRAAGYELLPPDVNIANHRYQISKNSVMLPLSLIKSIGRETVRKFLEARNNQKFKNYNDFLLRTQGVFGDKNIENLIYASALDEFGLNKKTLKANSNRDNMMYAAYLSDVITTQKEVEYSNLELMELEKQAYGFNIFHDEFSDLIKLRNKHQLSSIAESLKNNEFVVIVKISNIKEITTKTNQKMAFVEIQDESTRLDVTLFNRLYQLFLEIKDSNLFVFKIKKNKYQGRETFVAEDIKAFEIKQKASLQF
ncbi:MAG: DNA polymerase III subunit alpha [Acholeplasmataceae bacterium]|jgi:DNA polymerase-3 subunit alpha